MGLGRVYSAKAKQRKKTNINETNTFGLVRLCAFINLLLVRNSRSLTSDFQAFWLISMCCTIQFMSVSQNRLQFFSTFRSSKYLYLWALKWLRYAHLTNMEIKIVFFFSLEIQHRLLFIGIYDSLEFVDLIVFSLFFAWFFAQLRIHYSILCGDWQYINTKNRRRWNQTGIFAPNE